MSTQEAADLLVDRLWTEDANIQAVCGDLERSGGNLRAVFAGDRLSSAARRGIVSEATANLDVLWRALGMSSEDCSPEALVAAHLEGVGLSGGGLEALGVAPGASARWQADTCRRHLDERFGTDPVEAAELDRRRARLVQTLRESGVTADRILADPISVARLIDFSPAIVFSVVYFSDRLDDLASDLADSLGFASGLVGLLVRQVAAELMAVAVELVLDELEQGAAVHPASVSRAACHVYETAGFRPETTVRLLRRLILRVRVGPDDPTPYYPLAATCDRLSPDSVCEDVLEEIGLEGILEPDSDARGNARYQALVPRLPEPAPAEASVTPDERATLLLEAAEYCPEPCGIRQLNELASLMLVARARQSHLTPAVLVEQLGQMEAVLRGDVGALRGELASLQRDAADTRAVLDALVNIMREGATAAGRLRRDLIETLSRLTECQAEFERVRQARLRFANEVLGVSPPLTCDSPNEIFLSIRFPGVRVARAIVCDPTQPLDFDFDTDNLFDTCEDVPLAPASNVLLELANVLADLAPKALVIIGHADERPVETRACSLRFQNNTLLSEARAEAVRGLIVGVVGPRLPTGVPVYTTGVGEVDPRVHCGEAAGDECHRINRRVALRLVGARDLDFDLSCVGGR